MTIDLLALVLQIISIWIWQANGITLFLKLAQLYYLQNKLKFVLVNSNNKDVIWKIVFFFFFNITVAFIFAIAFYQFTKIF